METPVNPNQLCQFPADEQEGMFYARYKRYKCSASEIPILPHGAVTVERQGKLLANVSALDYGKGA